jgi:hypothetical protein
LSEAIVPLRPFDEADALDWLRSQPDGRTRLPMSILSQRWGWSRQRTSRRLDAWAKQKLIRRRGKLIAAVDVTAPKAVTLPRRAVAQPIDIAPVPAPIVTPTAAADVALVAHVARAHLSAVDVTAYVAAVALAGAAAWFSIRGMVVLFPGAPISVVGMAAAMESAKLVTAGWLARRWRKTPFTWRAVLAALVAGLAVINAAGVYAQLVAAHVGDRGNLRAAIDTQSATIDAKLESQIHIVADLDRRLNQVDLTIEEAARRGRTKTALAAMDGQKKARLALVGERQREADALAALKTERATVTAKGRQAETEAAPIRYVAELLGVDTDSERAIRWLIALMVLCCDPLAIALTAATSARR